MNLRLRPGTPEDAEACGAICYAGFAAISKKHNFPPDFPSPEVTQQLMAFVLSRGDVYSVVAEADGRVGTRRTWTAPRSRGSAWD
jgi:hypothetical protein